MLIYKGSVKNRSIFMIYTASLSHPKSC